MEGYKINPGSSSCGYVAAIALCNTPRKGRVDTGSRSPGSSLFSHPIKILADNNRLPVAIIRSRVIRFLDIFFIYDLEIYPDWLHRDVFSYHLINPSTDSDHRSLA